MADAAPHLRSRAERNIERFREMRTNTSVKRAVPFPQFVGPTFPAPSISVNGRLNKEFFYTWALIYDMIVFIDCGYFPCNL